MANGQGGLSPLQQFIAQYMETNQFLESQRQAMAQEQAVLRQQENQDIEMFAGLLQQIAEPEQRSALADVFIQRNPQAEPSIRALEQSVPISIATRTALAGGDVDPADFVQGLRIGMGVEMTDEAARNLEQRIRESQQQNSQFLAELAERQRTTDINAALGFSELESRHALGMGQLGLGQQQLSLDTELGRADVGLRQQQITNQLNLGMLDANVRGMTFPQLLKAEHSREITALEDELRKPLHPARKQALQQQIADRREAMARMDELWAAQLANLVGVSSAGEVESMSIGQLLDDAATARAQIEAGGSRGQKEAAIAVGNLITELLNQRVRAGILPQVLQPQLEYSPGLFGIGGGARVVQPGSGLPPNLPPDRSDVLRRRGGG